MRTAVRLAIGAAGAVLIVGSLAAHSVVEAGSESAAAQTRVCVGSSYSLLDGCSVATHELTQAQFGRAYVVTDVGERDGVDQYELLVERDDGTTEQLAVRQTTTGKVPRYVLFLADLYSGEAGPPSPGYYELVTSSGGQQSSYPLTVYADSPPATSTQPTSTPTTSIPTGLTTATPTSPASITPTAPTRTTS